MHRSLIRSFSLCVVGVAALTACSSDVDDISADDPGEVVTISISQSRFETDELRVDVGTTVVFENTDAFAHTVTSSAASPMEFDSGAFGMDETFEITFDEPGEYPYFCEIHPTMRATIVVG